MAYVTTEERGDRLEAVFGQFMTELVGLSRKADERDKAASCFDWFPEYQGRRLLPILASWAIAAPVVERLTSLGIYAMQMGEDTMELTNAAALEQG